MCGTKAFRGLPESDSCVHFRTQARTGVSAPVSPLHLVPTTCGPSACRTQALSCPLPVCSTASPGPLPAPDQPLGAAYSAGLSLSHVYPSSRSPSISSIPAQSFYILYPLRDTDADSLQGFPQYTSLHHPLANVSKSRG